MSIEKDILIISVIFIFIFYFIVRYVRDPQLLGIKIVSWMLPFVSIGGLVSVFVNLGAGVAIFLVGIPFFITGIALQIMIFFNSTKNEDVGIYYALKESTQIEEFNQLNEVLSRIILILADSGQADWAQTFKKLTVDLSVDLEDVRFRLRIIKSDINSLRELVLHDSVAGEIRKNREFEMLRNRLFHLIR